MVLNRAKGQKRNGRMKKYSPVGVDVSHGGCRIAVLTHLSLVKLSVDILQRGTSVT